MSGSALWFVAHNLWAECVFFGLVALVMAEGAARSGADYRHAHARATGTTTGPCCLAWTACRGTVHEAHCRHTIIDQL
ncbi:hypothetical protein [Streptomyces sp. NPDC088554]|uniref:hypothetical protein n=1 Tax=Streptomyces sp. NPDC088554 TaxID=3365865 RepID=UPI0038109172